MKSRAVMPYIYIFAVLLSAVIALDCGDIIKKVQQTVPENVILIDPGHGGMDGGASSADGTLEKDINLEIAEKVRELAETEGWQVIMTREEDRWLCDTEEGSIRSRKTEDLRNRREILRKYKPDIAVSIHLNSFKEDPDVKGVQVFYPEGGDSSFAEVMQNSMNEILKVDKARTAMSKSDVFLFKENICPIVIIECGFMSNPEEADLLKTKEYQMLLAEGIITGIKESTGWKTPVNVGIIDSLD